MLLRHSSLFCLASRWSSWSIWSKLAVPWNIPWLSVGGLCLVVCWGMRVYVFLTLSELKGSNWEGPVCLAFAGGPSGDELVSHLRLCEQVLQLSLGLRFWCAFWLSLKQSIRCSWILCCPILGLTPILHYPGLLHMLVQSGCWGARYACHLWVWPRHRPTRSPCIPAAGCSQRWQARCWCRLNLDGSLVIGGHRVLSLWGTTHPGVFLS